MANSPRKIKITIGGQKNRPRPSRKTVTPKTKKCCGKS